MTQSIAIIDDEASISDAVSMILEAHGYATTCHEDAMTFLAAPFEAGCIVSDIRMPQMSGMDLLQALQARQDPRPVILLTGHGDVELAVQAIKLGAHDFIEKPFKNDRLLGSIRSALSVSEKALQQQAGLDELRERYASLSERQRDTMHLLIQGLSNKEIAQRLGISPRTVEIHRTWVMSKMSAKTLVDLVRMGMALGTG